jgi:hypothetical protein
MPDSGGVASRLPASIAVKGEVIDADKHNLTQDDNIQMLNNRVQKDGTTPFTAAQRGASATAGDHLILKSQVDSAIAPLNTFMNAEQERPLPGYPTVLNNAANLTIGGVSDSRLVRVQFFGLRSSASDASFSVQVSKDALTFMDGATDYRNAQMRMNGTNFITENTAADSYLLTAIEVDSGDRITPLTSGCPAYIDLTVIQTPEQNRISFHHTAYYQASNGTVNNIIGSGHAAVLSTPLNPAVRMTRLRFTMAGNSIAAAYVRVTHIRF